MNAQLRKAAKNVVAGDLIVMDGKVFEARRDAEMVRYRGADKAMVAVRQAHVGKGRLRNLAIRPNKQIKLAQVGFAYIAA